jgi:hypothetical protein
MTDLGGSINYQGLIAGAERTWAWVERAGEALDKDHRW